MDEGARKLRKSSRDSEMKAFSFRLESACDEAGIPGFRQGRQSHFKRQLGVSPEAVRRWFSGESIPRQETIRKLAKMLKVDPAWLQYGSAPEVQTIEKPLDANAATLHVAATMQFAGFTVAFSGAGDADFVAIKRGVSYNVKVVSARHTRDGYVFEAPYDSERFFVVGVAREKDEILAFVLDHGHLEGAEVKNLKRFITVEDGWRVGGRPLKRVTVDGIENGMADA